MPRAEDTKSVTVSMRGDAIQQLNGFAEKRGFKSTADYVRDLIAKDMGEQGEPIDFGLDTWGRKRKEDESSPPIADKPTRSSKKKAQ